MRYGLIIISTIALCTIGSCAPVSPVTDTSTTFQVTTGSLPAGATLSDNGLSLPALPEDKKTPTWVWNKNARTTGKIIQNMQYIPLTPPTAEEIIGDWFIDWDDPTSVLAWNYVSNQLAGVAQAIGSIPETVISSFRSSPLSVQQCIPIVTEESGGTISVCTDTDGNMEITFGQGIQASIISGPNGEKAIGTSLGIQFFIDAGAGFSFDGDSLTVSLSGGTTTTKLVYNEQVFSFSALLNSENFDSDSDGIPDTIDGCPNDPNKTDPGNCGCGIPDIPNCGQEPTVSYYIDFTNSTIDHPNTIVNTHNTSYNSYYGNSWRMTYPGQSLIDIQFDLDALPSSINLTLTHLTSYSASCPGDGYAPVDILINGQTFKSNYDVAENHSGSHGYETDTWSVNSSYLITGPNFLGIMYDGDACTHYWIQRIEITSP